MTTETNEKVQKVVFDALESFGVESAGISLEASLESLDIDSLDMAELSQIADEEFGVALKSDDVKSIKTVGDAIDLIAGRI